MRGGRIVISLFLTREKSNFVCNLSDQNETKKLKKPK